MVDKPENGTPALPSDVQRKVAEQLKKLSAAGVVTSDGAPLVASDGTQVLTEPSALAYAHEVVGNDRSQPPLQLVAKGDGAPGGDKEALKKRKEAEILKIKTALAFSTDLDVIKELSELIERITEARSTKDLDKLMMNISSAVANALGKADKRESPEDKMDKAFARIDALNKDINENFNKLDRHLTPDEKKKLKELEEEVEQRKAELERLRQSDATREQILAAEKALLDAVDKRTSYQDTTTKRLQNEPSLPPEHKRIVDDTRDKIKRQLEEVQKAQQILLSEQERIWQQKKASGASTDEIERSRAILIRETSSDYKEAAEKGDEEIIDAMLKKYKTSIEDARKSVQPDTSSVAVHPTKMDPSAGLVPPGLSQSWEVVEATPAINQVPTGGTPTKAKTEAAKDLGG